MPTYPYACTACGHSFEVQQSFSDPALTECPQCAGRLRKVFSSVGVVFKGSGFYRTDSRSGGRSGSSGAGSSGGEAGASGGSGESGTTSSDSGSTAAKDPGSAAKPAAAPASSTSSAPAAAAGS